MLNLLKKVPLLCKPESSPRKCLLEEGAPQDATKKRVRKKKPGTAGSSVEVPGNCNANTTAEVAQPRFDEHVESHAAVEKLQASGADSQPPPPSKKPRRRCRKKAATSQAMDSATPMTPRSQEFAATEAAKEAEAALERKREKRRRLKALRALRARQVEAAALATSTAATENAAIVSQEDSAATAATAAGDTIRSEPEAASSNSATESAMGVPHQQLTAGERPEPGDVVVLTDSAPPEFRHCSAVVTKVAEAHCTVVVLDESRRFGVGECWPCFDGFVFDTCAWRLDSRVVISGLNSSRTSHLNGFSGRITAHKKEGHPTFLCKPSDPKRPQFTLCVRLDDPVAAGEKIVVLEPRFLTPYADHVRRVTRDLGDLGATLSSLAEAIPEKEAEDADYRCGGA